MTAVTGGEEVILPDCTACPASLYRSCSAVKGPEWENSGDYGCGFLGCRLKCKHKVHTGDIQSCCLGWGPGFQRTCDPRYRLGSTDPLCEKELLQRCTPSDAPDALNPFRYNECQTYQAMHPEQANLFQKRYCKLDRMANDPVCRAWSMNQGSGEHDAVMKAYCLKQPNDPLCSCINSEITPCPHLFDKKCMKSGYKTGDMLKAKCPPVMNCNQYVNLDPSARALALNVSQDCSMPGEGGAGFLSSMFGDSTWVIVFILAVIVSYIVGTSLADEKGEIDLTTWGGKKLL